MKKTNQSVPWASGDPVALAERLSLWVVMIGGTGTVAALNAVTLPAFQAGTAFITQLLFLATVVGILITVGNGIRLARSRGTEGFGAVLKAFVVTVAIATASVADGISGIGLTAAMVG